MTMTMTADILALAIFAAAFCAFVAYQDRQENKRACAIAFRVKAGTEHLRPRRDLVFMRDFAKRLNGSKK